ncbi:hypothetical protein GCM10011571_07420 [Marinithermofilum abyssi]|uniref:Lipoprotein n=1 Tax=Marinithermofilum abyssi TaxID=1571185 RepID=A0A8J2VED8_9BACL|nr:hypothetical protein GCM10011571_07420 [Marinithermofilum abyssi]
MNLVKKVQAFTSVFGISMVSLLFGCKVVYSDLSKVNLLYINVRDSSPSSFIDDGKALYCQEIVEVSGDNNGSNIFCPFGQKSFHFVVVGFVTNGKNRYTLVG